MIRRTWAIIGVIFLLACGHQPTQQASGGSDDQVFAQVIQDYTTARKHVDPFFATVLDVEEDLDKFGDYPAPAYFEKSKKVDQQAVERLKKINPDHLSEKNRLAYRLFKEDVEVALAQFAFPVE